MRIAVLTSLFYQETKEIQGRDRIIWRGKILDRFMQTSPKYGA